MPEWGVRSIRSEELTSAQVEVQERVYQGRITGTEHAFPARVARPAFFGLPSHQRRGVRLLLNSPLPPVLLLEFAQGRGANRLEVLAVREADAAHEVGVQCGWLNVPLSFALCLCASACAKRWLLALPAEDSSQKSGGGRRTSVRCRARGTAAVARSWHTGRPGAI